MESANSSTACLKPKPKQYVGEVIAYAIHEILMGHESLSTYIRPHQEGRQYQASHNSHIINSLHTMHVNNSNSQTWPWFQPPPTNQQPLPLPPFADPFVIQQLLGSQANAMPYCEGSAPIQHFYSSPFSVGPVYQGLVQQHQHQHQYRAPSSGPSRNRRSKGRRKTEAQYPYHSIHELSGAIARDHPTGIHPVWMGAFNNPGTGGAWRPPSRNPSMVNRHSTRGTPYDRNRSGPSRTRRQRSDSVDLSIYEIPIVGSESSSNISGAITAPAPILSTSVHTPVPSTSMTPSSQSTSTVSSEMSDEDTEITTHTDVEEQLVEEDDFDTISLGSDTDYEY